MKLPNRCTVLNTPGLLSGGLFFAFSSEINVEKSAAADFMIYRNHIIFLLH